MLQCHNEGRPFNKDKVCNAVRHADPLRSQASAAQGSRAGERHHRRRRQPLLQTKKRVTYTICGFNASERAGGLGCDEGRQDAPGVIELLPLLEK
jgi:hypothetical protein